jgi:peptide/nickel transport system substrate-binding protein
MHAYFHRAYTTITDDAPAVWLYQPRQVAGIQRRIHTAYLRADSWWAHLADWYVPASERIPRDRIGLVDAAP